jgi:dedicator of cytokinesis protein 3
VRKEMTSRYVQFLVDLHAGLGNWVEAGIAQLYQINVLEWGDEKLEAFGNFPAELERERKERLYKAAISFFKQGEDWERAIAVSEELRRYYETVSFDYEALAQTLADEAELFRSIVSRPRYYQTYYRVCFYGNFPDDIKEKDFVYRGVKLEPVMDFTSRIKKKYPDAKLHMSVDPPSSDMRAKNPLIIGVNALHVEKEESLKLRNRTMDEIKSVTGIGRPMPPGVSNYRYNNDVCVFSYTKAVQKSAEEKPKNEFQDLWVQKTYVTTAASFPCNRRRVEIVGKREVMLSPIENAIDSVQEKNEDVMAKTEDVTKGGDVGPLSMVLNGAIDAAVNGGTSKYLEAFLSPKYCQEHPDAVSLQRVRALRDALTLQHELLGRGLEVFGKSCGPQLQGLHQHLGAGLERMGKQFTEKFAALQAFLK